MSFAIGGILAGLPADILDLSVAIATIGVIMFVPGIFVAIVMHETLPAKRTTEAAVSA